MTEESIEDVKQAYALLFKENATLRADAERYRHIRTFHAERLAGVGATGKYLDLRIDAALKETQ